MKLLYNRPEDEFFAISKEQPHYPEKLTVASTENLDDLQHLDAQEIKDSIEDGTIVEYQIFKGASTMLEPNDIDNIIRALDQIINN